MKEREFLDLLFEEPETISGLKNKLTWCNRMKWKIGIHSKYFKLTHHIIHETRDRIDEMVQSLT